MNIKEMLKDGYSKKQLYLIKSNDKNGKTHFVIVEDVNIAKKYKTSSTQIQPVTMLTKIKNFF